MGIMKKIKKAAKNAALGLFLGATLMGAVSAKGDDFIRIQNTGDLSNFENPSNNVGNGSAVVRHYPGFPQFGAPTTEGFDNSIDGNLLLGLNHPNNGKQGDPFDGWANAYTRLADDTKLEINALPVDSTTVVEGGLIADGVSPTTHVSSSLNGLRVHFDPDSIGSGNPPLFESNMDYSIAINLDGAFTPSGNPWSTNVVLDPTGVNNISLPGFVNVPVGTDYGSFSVTRTEKNNAPTASDFTASGLEDNVLNGSFNVGDADGLDGVNVGIASGPSNGTLTVNNGTNFVYTPNTNFFGNDTATFYANDGQANSTTNTATFSMAGVNDLPLLSVSGLDGGFLNTLEDVVGTVGVSRSDVEDGANGVSLEVGGATNGTVTLDGTNVNYLGATNTTGADQFYIIGTDTEGGKTTNTVNVVKQAVDDDPTISGPASLTVNEDESGEASFTLGDVDGDATSLIVTQPGNGTTSIDGNTVTYVGNTNYHGSDGFTASVVANGKTNSLPVSVTVNSVNDVPEANDRVFNVPEGSNALISGSGSDQDGDDLTFNFGTPSFGSLGSVTGTNALLSLPDSNFNGSVTVPYTANDGTTNSSSKNITVNFTPVNDQPIANSQSVTNLEDTVKTITLSGSDVETPANGLTYNLESQPTNGVAVLDGNTVTYTPNTNFFGDDGFTFSVKDGSGATNNVSETATVNIDNKPVNDAPKAVNYSTNGVEDTSILVDLNDRGSDVEGDDLTARILGTSSGSFSSNTNNTFLFTPDANDTNTVTFTYDFDDEGATNNLSNPATGTISVDPRDDAPTITGPGSLNVDEDNSGQLTFNLNDVDGDATTLTATQPGNGSTTVTNNTVTYTPFGNFNGSDGFTASVVANGKTNNLPVGVTVNPVNDRPTANGFSGQVDEDNNLTFTLTGNDVENGTNVTANVSNPSGPGVLTPNGNNSYTFTPNTNASGVFTFDHNVSDGMTNSVTQQGSITVNPVNDAPVAINYTNSTPEDTSILVDLNDRGSDVEGDDLTARILGTSSGTFSGNTNNTFLFTPDANSTNAVTFTYQFDDEGATNNLSNPATGTISVDPRDDAPTITGPGSLNVDEDNSGQLTFNLNDIDGDATSLTASGATNGLTSVTNNTVTYTPFGNFNGSDGFTATVSANGQSNSIPVAVTVNPVNDQPIANSQSVTNLEDVVKTITLSGSDIEDGTNLTYNVPVENMPTNGTLVFTGPNTVEYRPNTNFNGGDSFKFNAKDLSNDTNNVSELSTVTITNLPVNDAPKAVNYSTNGVEDTSILVDLNDRGSDVEGDDLTARILGTSSGSFSSNTNNTFLFTPDLNQNGQVAFTYQFDDEGATNNLSNVGIGTINVVPVNDKPYLTIPESIRLGEDGSTNFFFNAGDFDLGDSVTVSANANNGSLMPAGTNSFIYSPNTNWNGTDTITVTAVDQNNGTNSGSFSAIVDPVNDRPNADSFSGQVNEDGQLTFTLTGDDVENGTNVTANVFNPSTGGTLTSNGGNSYTFIPGQDWNGTFTFDHNVSDGMTNSPNKTGSILVNPVNDQPIANGQNVVTLEDTVKTITLTGNDVEDGTNLTYNVESQPTNGVVVLDGNTATYMPNTNTFGLDSFTFSVKDGSRATNNVSASATVTLNNLPVNDAPFAQDYSTNGVEDTSILVDLNDRGSDVEGEDLTARILGTSSGSFSSNTNNTFLFTPDANSTNAVTFTYQFDDEGATNNLSNPATGTIGLGARNDNPTLTGPGLLSVDEDSNGFLQYVFGDVDGDNVNVTVSNPGNGLISRIDDIDGSGPAIVMYRPNTNFNGSDTFTVTASDGNGGSTNIPVGVTVNPVNDDPTVNTVTYNVPEDSDPTLITGDGDDVDGDQLTFDFGTPTTGTLGSVTSTNALLSVPENFNGAVTVPYTANDGTTNSADGAIVVNYLPVNDQPVANSQSVTNLEDTVKTITLSGSDIEDGTNLTYNVPVENMPTNGTLVFTGPNTVEYRPNTNFNGGDSFQFNAKDLSNDTNNVSELSTVTITNLPVNDVPTANLYEDSTLEGVSKTITLTGNDVDGDDLEARILTGSENGTLTRQSGNTFLFTPGTNGLGTDRYAVFQFDMHDGTTNSAPQNVAMNITSTNQAPTIDLTGDFNGFNEDMPHTLNYTITDPNGDTPSLQVTRYPTNGTLTVTADALNYVPRTNYFGQDSFRLFTDDGKGGTDGGDFVFNVKPVNDAPVYTGPTSTNTLEGIAVNVSPEFSDVEGDSVTWGISGQGTNGVATIDGNDLRYTPDNGKFGNDSVTINYGDGISNALQRIDFTINPNNRPPQITDITMDGGNSLIDVDLFVRGGPYVFTPQTTTNLTGNPINWKDYSLGSTNLTSNGTNDWISHRFIVPIEGGETNKFYRIISSPTQTGNSGNLDN